MHLADALNSGPISAEKLGAKICDALGLKTSSIVSMSLDLVAGQPAMLHVRMAPPASAFDELLEILAQSYLIADGPPDSATAESRAPASASGPIPRLAHVGSPAR